MILRPYTYGAVDEKLINSTGDLSSLKCTLYIHDASLYDTTLNGNRDSFFNATLVEEMICNNFRINGDPNNVRGVFTKITYHFTGYTFSFISDLEESFSKSSLHLINASSVCYVDPNSGNQYPVNYEAMQKKYPNSSFLLYRASDKQIETSERLGYFGLIGLGFDAKSCTTGDTAGYAQYIQDKAHKYVESIYVQIPDPRFPKTEQYFKGEVPLISLTEFPISGEDILKLSNLKIEVINNSDYNEEDTIKLNSEEMHKALLSPSLDGSIGGIKGLTSALNSFNNSLESLLEFRYSIQNAVVDMLGVSMLGMFESYTIALNSVPNDFKCGFTSLVSPFDKHVECFEKDRPELVMGGFKKYVAGNLKDKCREYVQKWFELNNINPFPFFDSVRIYFHDTPYDTVIRFRFLNTDVSSSISYTSLIEDKLVPSGPKPFKNNVVTTFRMTKTQAIEDHMMLDLYESR